MKLFFKHITNKKAETILEVTIALFIIGVGVTVSSMVMHRTLNITAQNKLWMQAIFLANEGLEGVKNIRDTNWLRYPEDGCWKTIETGNSCSAATSPMMADTTNSLWYYSIFFDHIDFTWELADQMNSGASNPLFDSNAIRSRLPNEYSIHEKFLGPSDTKPIYIAEATGADNTYFYRRIKIQSMMADLDGDSNTLNDEILVVTSQVKWPYKNKVNEYSVSTMLTNYKE